MAQVLCWMLYIYNFILPPQLCGRLGGARDYVWCNPDALLIVWAFPETTWALLFKSLVGSLWCQNWGFIKMSLWFHVGSSSESCSAKEQLRRGEKGNYVTDHWCFAFGDIVSLNPPHHPFCFISFYNHPLWDGRNKVSENLKNFVKVL